MNVVAFNTVIAWENIFVFKRHHDFISTWKKHMITGQVNYGQEKRRNQVGSQKAHVTHAGIEHGHDLRIASHTGSKKDHGDQRKYWPQKSVDVRNKIEVVIKEDLFLRDRLVHEFFDVLTEINGDGNNGEHQRREEKGAQVFADDIAIKNGQGIPDLRLQT